jgi:hypothetical protein
MADSMQLMQTSALYTIQNRIEGWNPPLRHPVWTASNSRRKRGVWKSCLTPARSCRLEMLRRGGPATPIAPGDGF